MDIAFIVIIGIVAALVLLLVILIGWGISVYNRLVSSREFVKNGMGQIAAQIESRWDAVANLIGATKQYAAHEAQVIGQATAARTHLGKDSHVADVERDDASFENVLGRIQMVAENYPDLKASGVYQNAMTQIGQLEDNVRSARMIFNDSVTKHNRTVLQFPSSIVASIFRFRELDYFQHTATKSQMPSW